MRDHQNIGKKDGRVETEPTNRLQGDFGRQFRIKAEIEEVLSALAKRPIFGQVTAGLAHQPERRPRQAFTAEDSQDRLFHGHLRHTSTLN
jgi:hypothetical protein